MEIEYFYNNPKEDKEIEYQIKQMEKANTIGCLISGLIMLSILFIFLTLLPFILVILGYMIVILAIYIIYKAYLESYVLNFIQKHNLRR